MPQGMNSVITTANFYDNNIFIILITFLSMNRHCSVYIKYLYKVHESKHNEPSGRGQRILISTNLDIYPFVFIYSFIQCILT